MQHHLIWLMVLWAATGTVRVGHTSSIGFEQPRVRGVRANVVTIDLSDPGVKVTVALAEGFPATQEPFQHMLHRSQPAAAITGTFFSTRSLLPVGDIVRDGELEYRSSFGTALTITPDNQVQIRPIPRGQAQDWSPFETVLACGPTLVKGREVHVAPRHEGFRDPSVLGRARRTAVGATGNGKLKLVQVSASVSLYELAKIMRDLGCVDALNLDGGSSSALYYRGSVIAAPGRSMVNLLAVHENVPALYRYAPGMPGAEEQRRRRSELAHEMFLRARQASERQDWRWAAHWLESAARLDGQNAGYYVQWAEALHQAGTPEQIGAAYAKAAAIYADKGLNEEAIRYYEEALVHHPRHLMARRELTRLLIPGELSGQLQPPQMALLRLLFPWLNPLRQGYSLSALQANSR